MTWFSTVGGWFSAVGPFLLLLGPLVVIHELGHFLVAKFFGVRCERFSIGFGPRLLSYQYGETEYMICALPLGGYVKMLGETDEEVCTEEERERSFMGQSPLRRTLIALAGPAANLILAVGVIAGVLMTIGWPTLTSLVGRVMPESAAAEAGIRDGDRIVEIGGREVTRWDQILPYVQESGSGSVEVVVDRRGTRIPVAVEPKLDPTTGKRILGVRPSPVEPVVVLPDPTSIGARAGLQSGDLVQQLGETPIVDAASLDAALEASEGPLEFVVARQKGEAGSAREDVQVRVDDGQPGAWSRERLGLVPVDFAVGGVAMGSPARQAGIEAGDIFLQIAGRAITSFTDVKEQIQSSDGEPLQVVMLRDGQRVELEVVPRKAQGVPPGEPERFELGVRVDEPSRMPEVVNERELNPFTAIQLGSERTYEFMLEMVAGVGKLVTREVGLDAVAGPIGIGEIAANAFQEPGWFTFLRIMAFISVNLAVINLLPIPMLDGGHIVFAGAEAVSGGPLSVRTREIAQVFGISFIVLLMGFAFWNDISRNWHTITAFWQNVVQ